MWIHVDSSCFYRFDYSSQKENFWSEGSPLQGLKAIGSVQSCCKQQHPLAKSAGTVLSKGSEITHIRRLALEFRSRSWSSLSEHIPKLPCCMIFPKLSSNGHLLEVNPYAYANPWDFYPHTVHIYPYYPPWCFPFPHDFPHFLEGLLSLLRDFTTSPRVLATGAGDDVFGESPGCLRRYNCGPAALLSPKPASWSFEEAQQGTQGSTGGLWRLWDKKHMRIKKDWRFLKI